MTMNRKRFQKLVSSFGTEISRWPEAEWDAALKLLETDETASSLFRDAASLDALLNEMPNPAPADEAFLKRLATIPFASRSLGENAPTTFGEFIRGFFPAKRLVPQGLGLAAIAVFGIWMGFASNGTVQNTVELEAAQYFLENPDITKEVEDLS